MRYETFDFVLKGAFMKRKIYNELINWKNTELGRTALLIDGARRVGKSYIAEEFAKNEYKSYIMIDFNRASEDIKELFANYLEDLDMLFMYLSNFYNVKLYERETLFILDEVQLCPKARAAIKYLIADGRYDYLETGSLMTIKKNVKDILIPSEERHIKMYPLDFEEFLWALDCESFMEQIKTCFEKKQAMGQAFHRKAMDYFRQYLIVGGMPQAVAEYIDTKDFDRVDRIKRDILELYRADIIKHAEGYEMKVEQIFDDIPAQLQKHDKKFKCRPSGQGTARACVQRAKEVPGGQGDPLAAGLLGPAPLGRAGAAEPHWGIGPTRASEGPP